jgi:hypothetical protein
MRSVTIQRVRELPPPDKQALERLIGRQLDSDEEVSIRTYPHDLPSETATRQRAVAHRESLLAERAEKTEGLAAEELDHAADEAIKFVRWGGSQRE